ncbi:Zeaxanthin epoxidase [Arachis hypogaea]|nr:Zeaxanthin epoxidase [Arachis hypogaea]
MIRYEMESIVHPVSIGRIPKYQVIKSNATSLSVGVSHKCLFSQLPSLRLKSKGLALGAIHASASDASQKWLLQPVGDGDTRHIGFKVEMPGAYEIASREVTVGRVPEKADLVIPVATVSAVHARIQKKQGNLLVTDLDSTNGTFVDDKRLRPGVVTTVSPGSNITFGTYCNTSLSTWLFFLRNARRPSEFIVFRS